MRSHRCEYCGNVFDPVERGVCPNCGAAVSAAVMTEIEREQAASRDRVARMKEDIVRRHEQDTRSGRYGWPTRLPNASRSPWRTDASGKRRNHTPGFVIVAIFVIMLLVSFVRSAFVDLRDQGGNAEERVEQPVSSVESDLPQEDFLGSLGDTLRSERFAVTAVALRDYACAGYETMNLPEGSQIIAVELRVKNVSQSDARLESIWGLAYDADGTALVTNEHAPNDAERANRLSSGWFHPDSERVGRVFFEIPENAASLTLVVDGMMYFTIDLK